MIPALSTGRIGTRALYTRAICLATLTLILLCWPLWLDDRPYPRVPFIRNAPTHAALPFAIVLSLLLAAALLRRPVALMPALCLTAWSVLGDQDRLQPWVYQFLVVGTALAATPDAAAIRLARGFHALMYFHSGLSKLDHSFARELGRAFLSVPARVLALDISTLPAPILDALALSLPALEVVLAAFLLLPRTRVYGLALAIVLHLGILAVLGPWGLNHGATVLVWNLALLAEEWILFATPLPPPDPEPVRLAVPVRLLFGTVALMPLTERLGVWDTWPSFAVYASHNERAEIDLHTDDRDLWPTTLRPFLRDVGDPVWRRLDLMAWSRATRGAPPYPQVRTTLGIARSLLTGPSPPRTIRVVIRGRANRWTGSRTVEMIQGRDSLDRRLHRFRLNAWPVQSSQSRPPTRTIRLSVSPPRS
ncbi:MAG: hypothetical protein KatS3mg108_3134 [Isosphaeraceae bacterium]|jgi:hypothetical protein|nr:MAG: hypothetical protein KatS3mg108_3134 [Isosphaeraceae bacterium]